MGHDIFLSYRRADQALARALVAELESRGVGIWWDAKIEAGVDWRDAIVENLVESDMLVILFSDECNSSKQLKKELAMADDLDKDVIPILIEDTKPKGHFLYELAARNWLQAFPHPEAKISELSDHLTKLAEKSPGGLEGVKPITARHTDEAQAPTVEDTVEAPPKRKSKPKKVKPPKAKKSPKDFNDFLPFKWIDLLPLGLSLAVFVGFAHSEIDAGGGDASNILALIIIGVAIVALYGALIFPFRYYFRRRRLSRAALMYFLSSISLYVVFLGLFAGGKTIGLFPYDDISEFAVGGGVAWLIFGGFAMVLYAILTAQRAIRSFNSNVQKI
ncbi:MAG: toll/interleukin-1 receptor domain-containing protein [Pseudomonadota bacterium]